MSETAVSAGKVEVLSAGAVEPGLVAVAQAFEREHRVSVVIIWATTPTIRRRIGDGEVFDILIVPNDAASDLARAGSIVEGLRAGIGSVGVGVAVRAGATQPAIDDDRALEAALLRADAIVFTRATSGIHVESMLKAHGLYDRLLAKITRFVTGPEMMEHLIHSVGDVICLGAIVELKMFHGRGIDYLGPLPDALQNYTAYVAVLMRSSPHPVAAERFLRYLATPGARREFAACGVETDLT